MKPLRSPDLSDEGGLKLINSSIHPMSQLNIIHLGIGSVGKAVMDMIIKNTDQIREKQGIELKYCGFFTSKEGYYYPFGFPFDRSDSYKNDGFRSTISDALERVHTPFVVIDTTDSDETAPYLLEALKNGGYVVLSNKKPLSSSQELFTQLHSFGENKILYETTVCASLPVINTLHDLLVTGDEVLEISGCFSGTLGYMCSMMEHGRSYSESIKSAIEKKFTEDDPREDLSGLDSARKALILARVMGYKMELADVLHDPFYPEELKNCSMDEFLSSVSKYDAQYAEKFAAAKKNGNTIRNTVQIGNNQIKVSLKEVPETSPMGRLKELENIVIYTTKRYKDNPLVIQGPSLAAELAAGSVLADILKIGK